MGNKHGFDSSRSCYLLSLTHKQVLQEAIRVTSSIYKVSGYLNQILANSWLYRGGKNIFKKDRHFLAKVTHLQQFVQTILMLSYRLDVSIIGNVV